MREHYIFPACILQKLRCCSWFKIKRVWAHCRLRVSPKHLHKHPQFPRLPNPSRIVESQNHEGRRRPHRSPVQHMIPTDHILQCHIPMFWSTSRMVPPHSLGSCACADCSLERKLFPVSNLNHEATSDCCVWAAAGPAAWGLLLQLPRGYCWAVPNSVINWLFVSVSKIRMSLVMGKNN